MTITHPDQIAKTREFDSPGVMFPRGAHQMVAYCYAMEGVPATERSVHAKLTDMMDDGLIEGFSVAGVNMSGSTTLEKRGECAALRQQVEAALEGDELHVVKAKFGNDNLLSTYDSVVALIDPVWEFLSTGPRKATRNKAYVGDLVWHVTCSPAGKEKCTVCNIAGTYSQLSQATVSRDATAVSRYIGKLIDSALEKVTAKFSDGDVLRCASE